ncbi:hypothetical protein, partial [Neisseria meningitidis]|uniref:hypothetical protein n=1 Tax=Neisseria meningitidis TaxID=487 RepID=UPI001C866326
KATKPQTVQIVRQGEATLYWFLLVHYKKRRKYSGLTNAGMTKSNLSASFPRKRESRTPNVAGIYRKKPKPNRLDSRLRGNDEKQPFRVLPAKAGI